MDIIPSVTVPEGAMGQWRIERKRVSPSKIDTLQGIIHGGRYVPEGEYTFLYRSKTLVMSDTPDEKRDHYKPVSLASGSCLVAGLGIGMVLNAMCQKTDVNHVTVIELSQDVIDLVSNHYNKLYPGKITFICADIMTWKPPKEAHYTVAWFDIWDYLCIDNLKSMAKLHRRFARKADWKGSWGKEYLQYQKRKYERENWRRL